MSTYLPRIVDDELEELMADLPAIAMEGAKGVGETATARRRTRTTIVLDRPSVPARSRPGASGAARARYASSPHVPGRSLR